MSSRNYLKNKTKQNKRHPIEIPHFMHIFPSRYLTSLNVYITVFPFSKSMNLERQMAKWFADG